MVVGARSFECPPPPEKGPCQLNGFRGHVAALEFARTPDDVKAIVGDLGNPNRDVMRRQLNRDFIFIALYLVLYLLLAVALSRATSFAPLLTVITVVAAVCAAGFDVLENLRTLRVLNLPLASLNGAQVAGILDAAVIKWTFVFVTSALLSLAFRHGDGLSKLLRALLLLTAVIGLVGLVSHPIIPSSMLPLFAGLLVLMVSGFFWPLRLIRDS
jgi:Trk-type K+ transport system membrane component